MEREKTQAPIVSVTVKGLSKDVPLGLGTQQHTSCGCELSADQSQSHHDMAAGLLEPWGTWGSAVWAALWNQSKSTNCFVSQKVQS